MATWAARSALALAALVQQRVYPRRIWRATFCLTGHVANREQKSEVGVDDLDVTHARTFVSARADVTSLLS